MQCVTKDDTADDSPTDPTPDRDSVPAPCLAGFFLVLPEAVPVPDNSTWTLAVDEVEPSLAGTELTPIVGLPPLAPNPGFNFVSLRFIQVDDSTPSTLDSDSAILMKAVAQVLPTVEKEPAHSATLPGPVLDRFRTVVEMVTYVATDNDWFATNDRPDPLTRCIERLFDFHRAYRVFMPVPSERLTYKRLHPMVIHTRRGAAQEVSVIHNIIMLDMRPNRIGAVRSDMQAVDFDSVNTTYMHLVSGSPVTSFMERRTEAHYAFSQLGKNAESVIHAATACEILFDGLLGLCLYEDASSEAEAISAFSEDLTPRVKKRYAALIGGDWSLSSGAIGDWYERVAGLRNKVVHTGYEPWDNETEKCLDVVGDLSVAGPR